MLINNNKKKMNAESFCVHITSFLYVKMNKRTTTKKNSFQISNSIIVNNSKENVDSVCNIRDRFFRKFIHIISNILKMFVRPNTGT